jgi:hypothetical protein
MKRALLVIPFLTLLCGCPPKPVTLKTITLYPSQQTWSYEYWHQSGPCVGTFGTGPWPIGAGEVASGFSDDFQSLGPFGCDDADQQLYRGRVAFDLHQFNQIVDATLNFNVNSSFSASVAPDGGIVQDNPAQGYATTLGMSTGTKDEGNGPYYSDFDNAVSMPSCTSAMFIPCSVDVTSQAKMWVAVPPLNLGFIIAGPILDFPDSLPHDNDTEMTLYSTFTLQVLYNPALNPLAPQ